MATFLYRLGKASYERAGRVLLAWLIGLIAVAGGDSGRIVQAVTSLVAVAAIGFASSRLSLGQARERSVRDSLGLSHSV